MSSSRKEKYLALASLDYNGKSSDELKRLCKEVLEGGMHGLCFSPYEEGQKPGEQINEEQIRRRMEIIRPYTDWVRSFSCTEGNELIPKIAREYGIKTMVGAWLGDDPKINEQEVTNLIQMANEGYVDIAAVGNEVLLRGDLTEDELLGFMGRVKQAIPDVPMGYVDAYYEFSDHPRIADACDVILANCYPFWEGCDLDYSLLYMKDMYQRALRAAKGKKVIISETGWPSQGSSLEGAYPSLDNMLKYFMNTQKWAQEDDIEIFYFSSFDESWKVGAEGDVGAYWGLWDAQESLKF
ncbi:glycosyl hydrolase family 17 protein [Flagellimonas meridianipacifica]|uniref:Endo-1,3-beta-glucanase btgC n=1 Tax=Flagellimonas meridianipacifica TaxID=1080225 RepID=A0A2T0MCV9_9FLAO|nr:glycosyl hydrolase family 17 protein [Allomuricauda pacifica]PRX55335.1 exo-beta-1,3-glucanase (GH17 family) [Allomuricauda pacifica]